MRTTPRKVVFISYSWKDKSVADRVRESIPDQFEVWIDREQIGPGESVSKAILDGLNGSDYYVLLISENSVSSNWVKREIATAFELANKTKLSVIPVLLQGAEVRSSSKDCFILILDHQWPLAYKPCEISL
jgi:hypothetical protein